MRNTIWLTLGLLLLSPTANAQKVEITGYDDSGILTFTTTHPDGLFTLEFSTDLSGAWTNWGAISDQPITGQVMSLPTPVFYRIRQKSPVPPDVISNHALRVYLATHGYDKDGDFRISGDEAGQVRQFFLHETGFSELNVDPMTNMTRFGVWYATELTNVVFGGCSNLQEFWMYDSRLTDLTLPPLSTLTKVRCYDNPFLTNISISVASAMTNLHCNANALSVLDISSNTNLLSVNAQENPLTEIIVWWNPSNAPPIELEYDGSPLIRNP